MFSRSQERLDRVGGDYTDHVKRTGILGWFNDELFGMNLERSPGFPELRLYLSLWSLISRALLFATMLAIAGMCAWLMILSFNASEPGLGLIFAAMMSVFAYFGAFRIASGFSKRQNHLHLNEYGLEVVDFGQKTFWAWNRIEGFTLQVGRTSSRTWVGLKGAKPLPPVFYRTRIPEDLDAYAIGANGYSNLRGILNAWLERYGAPEKLQ